MNTTNYIRIFRGDDSDALGYQTIVGTIKTDLDLTGCKAVFRFLGFYAEFNPIPEDKKLTIVVPAQASRGFPPGVGYASLKVFDSLGKIRTFTNRIPVIVDTMTPSCGCGEFEVSFSPFPELEPLKIFIGPNTDDFDQYTGFLSKIIDRASLTKYGLAILADTMGEDGGASGKAASPLAVKAAYDAIIATLTDNYYTSEQTDEAIDRVAAYYITYDAAGNPFPTYAALANATTVYSGGEVRVPTRNDYCVVLADETHDNAEYRYIYAVAEGETTGSWQPQFPVEGVMTVDQSVTKNSQNPVSGGGVWSAIWGALSALPTGFSSLYDWCVSQLAGKASKSDVDPLLFAQYYPEGNVKSAAEFTQGIKYNDPDTVNRTITVKPFCNTGDSANDNSGLVGRVVVPPFVDGDGNPYISDDGTRFKVVGVSGGYSPTSAVNTNLTAIITPNTVATIGDKAFSSCTALTSLSLPAATTIKGGAFNYCAALTSLSLPAATTIKGSAFSNCIILLSVDFGDTPRPTVPTLGVNAFMRVPAACKIIVPYTQYDEWIAADGWKDLPQEFVRHSEKADKPATFTTGNLAKFDSNGNPTDSGKNAGDFQAALTAQQLANIAAVSDALAFDATHSYAAGDPVVYNGTLYTFTSAHTGAWTGSDVSAVDIIARLAGKLDKSGGTMTGTLTVPSLTAGTRAAGSALGNNSVAEGSETEASGSFAHAEGLKTEATNRASHAEGVSSAATGSQSHAEGFHTSATNYNEHAQGAYNASHTSLNDSGATLHSIGIGTADNDRKNAVETMRDGKTFIYGIGGYDGTNPTAPGVKDLATAVNDKADVSAIPYALVTKTINNNAVTLDDRAINAVAVSSSLASLTVDFPPATSGKVRDFGLRLTVASGITTAPQLVLPQGVTCENADGAAPEIGADGATTILYFTETAAGVFLVKGEVVQTISNS